MRMRLPGNSSDLERFPLCHGAPPVLVGVRGLFFLEIPLLAGFCKRAQGKPVRSKSSKGICAIPLHDLA